MKIITISREFGSGGRELGKRLADFLGYAYYDKEIVTAIAQQNTLNEGYVEKILDQGIYPQIPLTFGRTFSTPSQYNTAQLLGAQEAIIKELATKGNCVIVGRGANIILEEFAPFNIFVYADMPSKLERCRERATPEEKHMSPRDLQRKIRQVDNGRAKQQELLSSLKWGDKKGYHLCVNTSGMSIKALTPQIASFAQLWLGEKEQ